MVSGGALTPMGTVRGIAAGITSSLLAITAFGGCVTGPRFADKPVRNIADQRLTVRTAAGSGVAVLYVSRDWTVRQPEIARAIVLLHGTLGRDVFVRMASELAASRESGRDTILIAPQFVTLLDVSSHRLPDEILRWRLGSLGSGADAIGPAAINPFEVVDAIIGRLADRTIFPALGRVVIAGHSGGGQMAQRYAVVGHGDAVLAKAGIRARYVVANPSSYLYFSDERPTPDGRLAPFASSDCPSFNRWRYGLRRAPPYVGKATASDLERAYVKRDVVYLLGTGDIDPHHFELDTSCAGEAQGPHRHARGVAYVRYLRGRHPDGLTHRMWEVPAVGHDGDRMLLSTCGLAALYGGTDLPDRCDR